LIKGIKYWQHLSQKIAKHEKSIQHIEAVKLRTIWIKNQTIDVNLEKQISVEAKFWRDVLTRIIKIILFLTAGNTALRGNEGKGEKECEGNFLRTVRLLAEFDPVLNTLLTVEENKVKYLSWSIQNEVIDLLATNIQNIICQEIREAPCFAIIIDSTQDICKVDQVSVIIRYTSLNYTLQKIDIKESFLGFFALHEHAAKDHVNLILETLIKFGIDINKCRGQGFDGASVMSGIHNGVKKRILDIVPNATYIHCNAHNLNLVLSDVARSTTKVSSFFDTVQEIFNFFSKSGPRWASLTFGDNVANIIKKKVLKKVCVTRWEARHDAVYALKYRYIDVLKSLTNISLTSQKTEERTRSIGIKNKIESFEFILLLTIWESILRPLYSVSKLLQSPNTTLHQACELLENCVTSIKSLRINYNEIVASSKILCSQWGISTQPKGRRRVFAKKHFDEINHVDEDRRMDITEDNFRVTVFLPIIDTALSQLQGRFEGMKTVHNNFDFLTPSMILDSEESELIKTAYDFVQFYQNDISSDFPRQLLSLKENLKNMKLKTIRDLSDFLLENDLCSVYSDIMTACIIFLTLPVTVASAERSFSKLKLIKNYLRISIGQERLSHIAVLNIEKNKTKELNIDKIIDDFAHIKARKKNFLK